MIIKRFEFFNEGTTKNLLYHSCKIEYGIQSLKDNKMKATTRQIFFKSSDRDRTKDERYEAADKFYGISTTRDKNLGYGDITFVFDRNKLKTKYKVIPFDFMGNVAVSRKSTTPQHTKYFEREEFVIISKNSGRFLEPIDRYNWFLFTEKC